MYPNSYDLNYDNDQTVAFFGVPFEVFNNWSAHRVRVFGREFTTAEAAFQFVKFQSTAPELAEKIAAAPSPWQAFQLTAQNRDKTDPSWKQKKADVMEEVIRAKVAQNADVKQRLIETGNRQIVENSPWDSFWGSGPDGNGQNMLGKIYMKIRAELSAEK